MRSRFKSCSLGIAVAEELHSWLPYFFFSLSEHRIFPSQALAGEEELSEALPSMVVCRAGYIYPLR